MPTRRRLLWLLLLVLPVGLFWLCTLAPLGAAGILPGAVAVAAVAVAALARAPWPAAVVAGCSVLADVGYSGPPQPPGLWLPVEYVALTVLLLALVRSAAPRAAALGGGLVALAATLLPLRLTLHVPGDRFEGSVLLVAAAFAGTVGVAGAGLYLRLGDHRRRHAAELARQAHRLDLARDLHDLVAHEVTGIVVAAQAAGLADIEAAGLRALDGMDRMVHTLRGPVSQRVHALADLPDVVHRFASTGPTSATLAMPAVPALSPAASKAAYHVVIEALTNVRRHAPAATTVTVTVTGSPGAVELSIVDTGGAGGVAPRTGGGSGLAGLDERVRALGGELHAGPHATGWRVTCRLPAAPP